MRRINVQTLALETDPTDPPAYAARRASFGQALGATALSAGVVELPPGVSGWPYHYEWGNEEWVLVLAGRPTLRHPGGEDVLEPGDVVAFPDGPDGAHKLTNAGDEVARIVMLSTENAPGLSVYPDSDKVSAFTGAGLDGVRLHRRDGDAGYWDGEA